MEAIDGKSSTWMKKNEGRCQNCKGKEAGSMAWHRGQCSRERKRSDAILNRLSPDWLGESTRTVLDWASNEFHRANLNRTSSLKEETELHIFTWTSSRANHALSGLRRAAWQGFAEGFAGGLRSRGFAEELRRVNPVFSL